MAVSQLVPGAQTIIEIGGQDSKIIIMRDGVVTDFAMNTVCAAGTGSFLDQQAARLNIPIERFGELALKSKIRYVLPVGVQFLRSLIWFINSS